MIRRINTDKFNVEVPRLTKTPMQPGTRCCLGCRVGMAEPEGFEPSIITLDLSQ
jgi:hypothetical protein